MRLALFDFRRLLDKAEAIVEVNHFEDPTYKVVSDRVSE